MSADSQNPFGPGVILPSNVPKDIKENNKDNCEDINISLPVIANDINHALVSTLDDTTVAKLTSKQVNNLVDYSKKIKFGFTSKAVAMVCQDEQCPFQKKCPLVREGIPRPHGDSCPMEQSQISAWTETFSKAAAIDPDDPTSAYDMMIVDQIVFQMVLESRVAMQLAMEPEIERTFITGYNPLGQPFYSKETSKAAEFYEKLVKTKMRLMRELLTTRKSKADAEAKGYADPSKVASNLMEKASRIRTALQTSDGTTQVTEVEIKQQTAPNVPKVFGEETPSPKEVEFDENI